MKINGIGRRELWVLLAVLLVAGLLRMAWPSLVEFKRDEALLLSRALDVATGNELLLRGISSSTGFPNTALGAYLYALPLLFWKDVYAAILFTGLVNAAGVLGVWWLVHRYWGATAAMAAGLMYAVSPWAIFHSQKIWSQNLLAPLAVAWAISACLGIVDRKKGFVALHIICLAISVQVHFAAFVLVPVTLLILVIYRRRVDWRTLLLGCFVALLTMIPFLIFLANRSGGTLADVSSAISTMDREFGLKGWRFLWLLSSGREIHALAGPEAFSSYLDTVPDLTIVHVLWTTLALAGAIIAGRDGWISRAHSGKTNTANFIVLAWLSIPPILFTLPILPVELHYLLSVLPVVYIVAGIGFARFLLLAPRWKSIAWIVIGASAAAQLWIWLSLFSFITGQVTTGGYGTPIKYYLEAASLVHNWQSSTQGKQVLIGSTGQDPNIDSFAAVFDVLLRDSDIRFVDIERFALFPAEDAIVVLPPDLDFPAAGIFRRASERNVGINLREGEGYIQVLDIAAGSIPEPVSNVNPPYLFANWVTVYGYDFLQSGNDTAEWRIYWQTADNPVQGDYHFFNHLLDVEGNQLSQDDGPLFSSTQWQAGDRVISVFTLTGAKTGEAVSVRTGIYTYPGLENVPLLDIAGNPAGDWVTIKPASWGESDHLVP